MKDSLGSGLVLFLVLASCVFAMVYLWKDIIRQTDENIRDAKPAFIIDISDEALLWVGSSRRRY